MIFTFLKGLLMGAADIVPGVSGGTIAFITGIYDRLIGGLGKISTAGRLALQGKLQDAWKLVDVRFFAPLALGIGIAFLIGSAFIPHLMETHPSEVFGFFTGLILASAWVVYSHIKEHTWRGLLAGVAGAALGFGVAVSPVIPTAPSLPWIGLLGFVAISAMLLPGISGSYILLILGQYEYMLEQIHERNVLVVGTFAVGAVLGLLIFSKLLAYVLKHWHSVTFSALLGIMVGALYGPGKIVAEDASWLALTLAVAGAVIVLVIERQARRA